MRAMAIDENSVDQDTSPLGADGHVDDFQCQKRQLVYSPSPCEMEEE
jgi:hypothetical protein